MTIAINAPVKNRFKKCWSPSQKNIFEYSLSAINGMIFVKPKPRSLDIKNTEISNAKSIKNVCNVSVHIIVLMPPRKV